jgi:ABC-type uncharacterized transport system involved in gliding motility auxiliary subunit
MKRSLFSGMAVILMAVFLVAINVIGKEVLRDWRLDLTASKLYTLSSGTVAILHSLDEPVTLRLYYSKSLESQVPGLQAFANRVVDLLQEYKRVAPDKIRLLILDPRPYTETEDQAVAYGLSGVPLGDGTRFYFGLVATNTTDGQETIPFVQPEREALLEYDISRIIDALSRKKKTKIGLLTTLPMAGGGSGMQGMMNPEAARPWVIYDQLMANFDVQTIEPTANSIDPSIDTLVLVQPEQLKPAMLYALDQFVLRGGRLLAFLDPFSELTGRPTQLEGLSPLLTAWGVQLASGKVAADLDAAVRMQSLVEGRFEVLPNPTQLELTGGMLDRQDPITSRLENVMVASAGVVEPAPKATTSIIPLLQTSPRGAALDAGMLGPMNNPQDLVQQYQRQPKRRLTLAARIRGPIKTAFPDGPPSPSHLDGQAKVQGSDTTRPSGGEGAAAANQKQTDQKQRKSGHLDMVLIADSDLLRNELWVQVQSFFGQDLISQTAANGPLVLNAVENLSGSSNLIDLRSRGQSRRPFQRLHRLENEARSQVSQQIALLQKELQETEQQLNALQSGSQEGGSLVLNEAQRAELERFRKRQVAIRRELRETQRLLRARVERLETTLKAINILGGPLVVGFAGVLVAWSRRRRQADSRGGGGQAS